MSARLAMTLRICATATLVICILSCCPARAQVTPQRLLDSAKEPQNWLTYSGDYAGHRFSALDQINTANAHALVPKWAYQTMAGGEVGTAPLVFGGVASGPGADVPALPLGAR